MSIYVYADSIYFKYINKEYFISISSVNLFFMAHPITTKLEAIPKRMQNVEENTPN